MDDGVWPNTHPCPLPTADEEEKPFCQESSLDILVCPKSDMLECRARSELSYGLARIGVRSANNVHG